MYSLDEFDDAIKKQQIKYNIHGKIKTMGGGERTMKQTNNLCLQNKNIL